MNNSLFQNVKVTKTLQSKIDSVDFESLTFGSIFTDHMLECDFENGEWGDPTVRPYGNIELSPSARVFHYGQAVFEGMKAFKDEQNQVWLFRPEENYRRFNISSKRLAIPEVPKQVFLDGLEVLVDLDRDWVQKGRGNSLYLRPFIIATEDGVAAAPSTKYKFMIICSPAKAYYSGEVRVVFAEKFSRAADGGVGFAKAAGNYAAQFYPTNLAKEEGYQQVVWTDASTHEYLEEAGTMNVFFRIGNTLITAPTGDRILDGITRKSVLQLAEHLNIPTEVRRVPVKEVVEAARSGTLKEMFGSGTAATINPISGFACKKEKFELPRQEDSYATLFKEKLMDIQYNISDDIFGWRHLVQPRNL